MSKRDYYEVLGLPRNATAEQIKRSFRNKARNLHPDNMDSGDEQAFKELAAAYEVLSDDNKRALYDRYGHDGLSGAGVGGYEGMDFGGFADLSEIFSQFFGGSARGGRRSTVERGADLKIELQLEFKEAIFGVERKISIKRLESCSVCEGSGAASGSGPVKCTTCNGAGQIRRTSQTLLGHFTQVLTCPHCEGEGERVEKACTNCKGRGQVRKSKEVELRIPAGIDSGARIRIPGAGDFGRRKGPAGDVYVVIYVNDHPQFVREGQTIHIKQTISYSLAALGGEILVPTVDGQRVLKIAPGVQTGSTATMKGYGAPQLNNASIRGDQIVHLALTTPTKLSSEERKLFEKLADMRGEKLTVSKHDRQKAEEEKTPSFLDRIVDVFRGKDDEA